MLKSFGLVLIVMSFMFIKTSKLERIGTAFKIVNLLNEGEAEKISSLILIDSRKSVQNIKHDSRNFKYITKKYKLPLKEDAIYREDKGNYLYPYSVEFPIFKGNDTLWDWKVREISLKVFFGSDDVNEPGKIAYYEIYYDKTILWNK